MPPSAPSVSRDFFREPGRLSRAPHGTESIYWTKVQEDYQVFSIKRGHNHTKAIFLMVEDEFSFFVVVGKSVDPSPPSNEDMKRNFTSYVGISTKFTNHLCNFVLRRG